VPVEQVRSDREIVPAVGGAGRPASPPAGGQAHLAHQPRDTPARMPPPLPVQLGVDPGRAVDPPASSEDAADVAAHPGFRFGSILNGGDRAQP
jgi:hypothetical protein